MLKTPSKAIKILLYLTSLTPVIFIEGFFYPFIITKTLYFRFLIGLAFSVYLLALATDFEKYKPKFNLGFWLVGGLFLINLIAAIFGLDFYKSIWSDFERMEGLIGLVYLILYLFLLINFFKTKQDWLRFIRYILYGSLFVSLYAIVQKFAILDVFEAGINRAASTLGNAAFLAGFLLLSSGLGIYYYLVETEKKYRIFALITIILSLWGIFLTSTRGAILGIFAGGLFLLFLNSIFNPNKKYQKYSAAGLIFLVLAGSGFYLARDNFKNSQIEPLRRMATISLTDTTAKNRLLVWDMAIEEIKERPLLGAGPENFNLVYNKYFSPKINEDWFDRTHNIYLDHLMNAGILGLLAYLAVLGYLFFKLFLLRKSNFYQFLVFSSLLIAYAVHNFFVFDVLSTAMLFFFLIGFISQSQEGEEGREKEIAPKGVFKFLIIILNLIIFYFFIFLPFKINRDIYTGYYYVLADQERSYKGFSNVFSQKLGQVEGASQMAQMHDVLREYPKASFEDKQRFYSLTKDSLEASVQNYPEEVRNRLFLGQLLINYGAKDDLLKAREILEKAVELSPNRPEGVYLLYNAHLQKGEIEKGVEVLEGLAERLPWFTEVKLMLAGALLKQNPEKADKYFKQAIEGNVSLSKANLKKIISYLIDKEEHEATIPYYVKLIEQEPERYDYRIDLSKMYFIAKAIDKAIDEINIINENNPEALKGHEEYLNMLIAEDEKRL